VSCHHHEVGLANADLIQDHLAGWSVEHGRLSLDPALGQPPRDGPKVGRSFIDRVDLLFRRINAR
jgi:hypothetical protein